MHPFCHLVIKGVRKDSPPFACHHSELSKLLSTYRFKSSFSHETLATKLGVSLGTLQNWERGHTQPRSRFWKSIQALSIHTT